MKKTLKDTFGGKTSGKRGNLSSVEVRNSLPLRHCSFKAFLFNDESAFFVVFYLYSPSEVIISN